MAPSKGQWVSPSGEIFAERMIPVRIAADVAKIKQIADMTAAFYEQEAVMYYKVSDEVTIQHYPQYAKPIEPEGVCTCHERDSSYVCDYCYSQGYRGHMQE